MCTPESENPLETGLGGEVFRGFDEARVLPGRIQRYGEAKARACVILDYLDSVCDGLPEWDPYRLEVTRLAGLLAWCGNYLVFKHYYTVAKYDSQQCKVVKSISFALYVLLGEVLRH
jgi:hypothetical protein